MAIIIPINLITSIPLPYPLLMIKYDSYKITDNINRFYIWDPQAKVALQRSSRNSISRVPQTPPPQEGSLCLPGGSWLPLQALTPSDVIIMIPGDRHKIHLNAAGSPVLPPCSPGPATLFAEPRFNRAKTQRSVCRVWYKTDLNTLCGGRRRSLAWHDDDDITDWPGQWPGQILQR